MTESQPSSLQPLPNCIVLGAQKCGTSSLHNYLQAHRDIFMSSPLKEAGVYLPLEFMQAFYSTCYGTRIDSREQLLREHMLQGYAGERYFGESPTHYTHADVMRSQRLAEVFHAANPKMRFIYLMRNPFARIASVYAHWLREGYIQPGFAAYMQSSRFEDDLLTTRYHYQIEPLLEVFGPGQMLLLQFESLAKDPHATLASIHAFLGLESRSNDFPARYEAYNVTAGALQKRATYGRDAYEVILDAVAEDVEALQRLLPGLDWDLSAARWVRENAPSLSCITPATGCPRKGVLGRARRGLGGVRRLLSRSLRR